MQSATNSRAHAQGGDIDGLRAHLREVLEMLLGDGEPGSPMVESPDKGEENAARGAYQVYVYDGSAAWIDESTATWGSVDAVPVGADVRISTSWVALNRGLALSYPKAMLERLQVLDPLGNVVASCDESTCRTFWADPYLYNDWFEEADWVYPANPKRSAGVWAVDWMVPFRPATAGTYTIVYSDKQIRTVADPMWATPGTVVPIYPRYDWYSWPQMTFEVE